MSDKFDFAFCMRRDCKICSRYLECYNKKKNNKKTEKKKNNNKKVGRKKWKLKK